MAGGEPIGCRKAAQPAQRQRRSASATMDTTGGVWCVAMSARAWNSVLRGFAAARGSRLRPAAPTAQGEGAGQTGPSGLKSGRNRAQRFQSAACWRSAAPRSRATACPWAQRGPSCGALLLIRGRYGHTPCCDWVCSTAASFAVVSGGVFSERLTATTARQAVGAPDRPSPAVGGRAGAVKAPKAMPG